MIYTTAFDLYGPDTIAISEALGIPEHEADRLINEEMNRRYAENRRRAAAAAKNIRIRSELREIRGRHGA